MIGHRWLRIVQAGLLALMLGVNPLQTSLPSLLPRPTDPAAGMGVPLVLAAASAPMLANPPESATLADFGPTLSWTNPPGAAQIHLQVLPANNDGPAIDLLLGSPVTSYKVAAPPEWYGLLPGMSYTWRVRVSDATTSVPLTDPSWSPWAERTFRTPNATAATITLAAPVNGGFVTTMTPALTWQNSRSDIFYYEFQLSKDQTFTTDPSRAIAMVYEALLHGGVTTPANSYVVPGDFPLEPNSVYYWRVRPRIQGDGTPAPWGPASIFRTVTPNPQVLYAGMGPGTEGLDLIVANADGSSVRNLTPGAFGEDRSPSWSPNRRQIVFESGRDNEVEAIYVMNAEGSGARRLSPAGQRAFNPVWSPDGEKIAFEMETGPAGTDIFVIRPDGSGLVNVSNDPANADTQPGWSPNSTHLVYTNAMSASASSLYVVAADSSGKRKLTTATGGQEDMASWSPDGSRIAYTLGDRTTDVGAELYVINADGSNPRSIVRGVIADWPVQWSPDGGTRLLYTAAAQAGGGGRAVWVVNADGSNPRNLSGDNQWSEDTPFWSPDGSQIAFTSNRADFEGAGGHHVYIMNADGSGKTQAGDFTTSVHIRDAGIWPPM